MTIISLSRSIHRKLEIPLFLIVFVPVNPFSNQINNIILIFSVTITKWPTFFSSVSSVTDADENRPSGNNSRNNNKVKGLLIFAAAASSSLALLTVYSSLS